MKRTISTCLLLAFSATPSLLLAQGPLVPPSTGGDQVGPNPPLVAGVPAPTMKTLHQVEPRTVVSADNTPGDATSEFIISTSGSYYLTGNLSIAGKIGISITAADVTLDLNGFVITGSSSPAGINIDEDADRCAIKNGSISSSTFGVARDLSGEDEASGGSFEDLTVTGHSSIGLLGGTGWTVQNCRIQGGGNSGIVVGKGSTVTLSTVRGMDAVSGTSGI